MAKFHHETRPCVNSLDVTAFIEIKGFNLIVLQLSNEIRPFHDESKAVDSSDPKIEIKVVKMSHFRRIVLAIYLYIKPVRMLITFDQSIEL